MREVAVYGKTANFGVNFQSNWESELHIYIESSHLCWRYIHLCGEMLEAMSPQRCAIDTR